MNPESLIIGGLCFGSSLSREESMIFLEKVYSLGIRDVDTGSLYGNGNSEILIAKYINKTGNKLRIHSKIGLEKSIRDDGSFGVKVSDLTPDYIEKSILETYKKFSEEKLYRVSIHAYSNSTEVSSQIEALRSLMDANIIENYGICNFNANELNHWIEVCLDKKLPLPKSIDLHFNLFEQRALNELFPILEANNISVIPYRVFCRGLLADRYQGSRELPPNSRASYSWRVKRYVTDEYIQYLNNLKDLARRKNTTILSLILNWTFSFKCISQICIGTSSINQLDEIVSNLNDLTIKDSSIIKEINNSNLPKNIFDLPVTFFEK